MNGMMDIVVVVAVGGLWLCAGWLGYLAGVAHGEMEERARHYARRWKRLESEREPEGDGADWWKKE